MVVRARSEYIPIVALLSVMLDAIDAESANELVRRDPDNALGHYLQGTLFYVSNRESEALDAFRKASGCLNLRFYDSTVRGALFQAMDALGFQNSDRLCALSWTISRWAGFSSIGIQPVYWALSELAKTADAATRSEFAEILLTLAGHLFATNFTNRWFAQRAAEAAFMLMAELAGADHAPRRNGYAAAVYGLTSPMFSCPGIKDWWNLNPLQLAQFLPDRIHRAFAAADPSFTAARVLGEGNLNPPEDERAALEAAKENAAQAAKKLIEIALSDPDGILGPYLEGLPQSDRQPQSPPVFTWTPVEGLLQKRPDVFQAAAASEEAMAALWNAGENSPSRRNIGRMMDIAWAIQNYAHMHDQTYPDSLAVLFESGNLKPTLEAKSVLTGRPYVYVGAGEKSPVKANDRAQFVLFYDDEPIADGWYECAFASCVCGGIRVHDLQEQMKKRGK